MDEDAARGCHMLVIVHGGAAAVSPALLEQKLFDLRQAAKAGFLVLLQERGKDDSSQALDAVQASVQLMEDSPYFNAGFGSSLTSSGEVEMDAIIADGKRLDFGAISSVTSFKNPVQVARSVLDCSEHCLFTAEGAQQFGQQQGIPLIESTAIGSAATASARKRKTTAAATAPSTPVPSSRGASSRSKKVAVAAAVIEEEEEEEDEPMAVDPPAPKPKKAAPTPRATARSRKAAAEEEEEMVVDATPVKPKKAAPAPRSTRGKKAPPAPVLAEKVDEEDEEEEEEEEEEEAPAKKPKKAVAAAAAPKAPTSRATARSRKAAADLAAAAAPEASAPEAPADDVPAAAAPPGPSSSSVPIQENGDEEEALPAKKEEVEEKKKEETEKDEGEEEVAMEVEEEEVVAAAAPASTSTTAAVTTEPSAEAAASTSSTTTTTTAPITTGSKRKASESADEGEAGQVAVPAAAAAATSADLSKEQSSSSVTTTTTAAAAASEAAAPSTVATTTSTTTKTSSTTSSSKRLRRSWSSGDLFTLGEPLAGELGPREKTFRERRLKRCEPSRVKLPGGGKARLVACGAYHTLVLSEAGDTLFSFGVNDDGGLGRITSKQAAAENGEKEAEKKNGNAGDDDAASSDDDASNSEEEEEDDDDYEEKMCAKVLPVRGDLAGRTLVKVTAGDMHSVALDSEGAVYLWGNLKDDSNKIGLFADDTKEGGDRLPTRVPRRVQLEGDNLASTKIVDIASGSHHVLLLTEAGEVLSLGEGSKGQLGRIEAADLDSIASKRELFIVPGKVDFSKAAPEGSSAPPPKIRRIFAGQWASFALSESGTLYAWGLNNYFQLGFRTAAPVEMTNGNGNGNAADTSINCPALSLHAELFPAVVPTTTTKTKSSIATSNETSTTNNGGENNNNNSENNNNNNSSTESSISMGEVVSVAVGQQHLTVLDSRGRVFTAGSVNYGKLGLGKAVLEKVGTEEAALDTLTPIPEAAFGGDRVEAVVCGDFSAFAITERGRLYGWGQGSAHIGTDVGEDAWEPRLMAGAYVEAREGGEGVRFISGSSGPQYGGWIGVIQEWAEETEKKA